MEEILHHLKSLKSYVGIYNVLGPRGGARFEPSAVGASRKQVALGILGICRCCKRIMGGGPCLSFYRGSWRNPRIRVV